MEKPIVVIARVMAKAGKEKQLKQALMELIEPSRNDDGCINYDLHTSDDGPGMFMFHETWRDKEALAKHLSTPHLRNFISKAEKFVDGEMNVTLWHKV